MGQTRIIVENDTKRDKLDKIPTLTQGTDNLYVIHIKMSVPPPSVKGVSSRASAIARRHTFPFLDKEKIQNKKCKK